MSISPITIYVGMALNDAPKKFRTAFHDDLKAGLRGIHGVCVLDFFWISHGPSAGDDIEVYNLDRQHVENADLCVFIYDYPSLGLGGETERREVVGKPFLAFLHKERKMSRYTRGLCDRVGVVVNHYQVAPDIVSHVKGWVEMYKVYR